ncbi:putative membrane protein [Kutzneria kofuensis]|uniref:Putative membrane protein n=2 Tax=Kutzneria kofuensis TaxID=103725 RepID=A0A7W9KQB6_9PSEU|nr:putative membrane protein [Kutzneria kofuensis]
MESVRFSRPDVHAMFEVRAADLNAVRPWAFHQGCYNALLALQMLAGLTAVHLGAAAAGQALVLAASASMLAAGVALIAFDPRRARIKGLIGQGAPALATLIALMA